jgi:hypothetical protein
MSNLTTPKAGNNYRSKSSNELAIWMHCQLEIKHLSAAFVCTEVEVLLRLSGNYCSVKCPPRKDVVGLGLILVFERIKQRCRGAKTIFTRTKTASPMVWSLRKDEAALPWS